MSPEFCHALFQTLPVASMRALFGADKRAFWLLQRKKKHKTPILFLQFGLTWEGYYATWSHYELPYQCVVQSGFFSIIFLEIIFLETFLIFICMKKSVQESKNVLQLKPFFAETDKNRRCIIFHLINWWWR